MPALPSLKRTREARLLTQQQLADRAGVHRVTIASIERGDDAQMSTVRKLALALDVVPEVLMSHDDPLMSHDDPLMSHDDVLMSHEDARVLRADTLLGFEAATVLKWLIEVRPSVSRDEYLDIWGAIFPNRQADVLERLIRGGFVVESGDGVAISPAP